MGPTKGYHHEPIKIFLATSTGNIGIAKALFTEEGYKVDTGLWYLGRYIGIAKDPQDYMTDKVDNWVKYVEVYS